MKQRGVTQRGFETLGNRGCGLVLPNPVFAHGQLYVALSRVSSATSLNVLIQDGPGQGRDGNDTYTQNIVYGEVLTA
jgi:hypothetical protein